MARSRSRRSAAPSRGASTSRQTRAVSRKQPAGAAVEAEVVEDAAGMGMEGAVAIITALMLFAGCLFLDYELGSHYGAGMFFK